MKEFFVLIDGYKTYVLVVCGVALWLGMVFGWWTFEDVDKLFGLLGLLGVASLRSALNKK